MARCGWLLRVTQRLSCSTAQLSMPVLAWCGGPVFISRAHPQRGCEACEALSRRCRGARSERTAEPLNLTELGEKRDRGRAVSGLFGPKMGVGVTGAPRYPSLRPGTVPAPACSANGGVALVRWYKCRSQIQERFIASSVPHSQERGASGRGVIGPPNWAELGQIGPSAGAIAIAIAMANDDGLLRGSVTGGFVQGFLTGILLLLLLLRAWCGGVGGAWIGADKGLDGNERNQRNQKKSTKSTKSSEKHCQFDREFELVE